MRLRICERVLLTIATSVLVTAMSLVGGAEAGTSEVHQKIAATRIQVAQKHQVLRAAARPIVAPTPASTARPAQRVVQRAIKPSQRVAPRPVAAPVKKQPAAPVAVDDPRGNVQIGRAMCFEAGFGEHWNALYNLWQKESGWNHLISNRHGSGAYGIPQALPGSKMKSHGADWKTNPRTQIAWGLDYIRGRYGNPSRAWSHFQRRGWY